MRELVAKDDFDRLPEKYRIRARMIKARVGEIDALLRPCDMADVQSAVLRMSGQFRDQPEIEHADMAAEYKAACRDLPAWAVTEAVDDFLAGRVDNHSGQFMPTCAEFAKRARSVMVPFLAERSALRVEASKLIERAADDHARHQIEMERQNPAVRRRVAELAEAFSAGSPKTGGMPHVGLSAEAQSRLDALKKPRQTVSKIGHSKNPEA